MRVKTALCAAVLAAALSADVAEVAAQRLLPQTRHFRAPVADPLAPRISVGLKHTNLLAQQEPERPPFVITDADASSAELVAAIALGAAFPLVQISDNVIVFADARVFSRFRIEYESRDDMGQDWFVGLGVELRRRALSSRVAVTHRSSHLGDEFVAATDARRIEFGGEQLEALVAYDVPRFGRVYGGGSWIFRSYLAWEPQLDGLAVQDRATLQVGADREWRFRSDPRVTVFGGVDVQAADRTDWDVGFSAAAGIGIRTSRSLRIMTRFYDGPSTMGEFFLTPERYFILELVAEL